MKRLLPLGLALAIALWTIGCDSGGENEIDYPDPREVAEGDYVTTDTGLKYYDFSVGDGATADSGSTVVVHYSLWLSDGEMIESSRLMGRGAPVQFVVGAENLIPGWNEGIATMKEGGDRQLVVPPDLAWGSTGQNQIPPNETVTFEIELLQVGSGEEGAEKRQQNPGYFTRSLPQ